MAPVNQGALPFVSVPFGAGLGPAPEPQKGVAPRKVDPEAPLSPTAIEKGLTCPRSWGHRYLMGRPDPQKPSAALGERVHNLLEPWLKTASPPDQLTHEGAIAMSAIPHLPPPSAALLVETKFDVVIDGLRLTGRKDLEYWKDQTLIVHDHKTCSSFQYMKTPEILRRDPQALIYAREAMDRNHVERVELNWLYILTGKKRGCKLSHCTLERADVEAPLAALVNFGKALVDLKRRFLAQPFDPCILPAHTNACDKFGGCPFKDFCNLTPGAMLGAFMSHAERTDDPMTTRTPEQVQADIQRRIAESQAQGAGGVPVLMAPPPQQVQPQAPQAFAPPTVQQAPIPQVAPPATTTFAQPAFAPPQVQPQAMPQAPAPFPGPVGQAFPTAVQTAPAFAAPAVLPAAQQAQPIPPAFQAPVGPVNPPAQPVFGGGFPVQQPPAPFAPPLAAPPVAPVPLAAVVGAVPLPTAAPQVAPVPAAGVTPAQVAAAVPPPVKRKPGRPRKNPAPEAQAVPTMAGGVVPSVQTPVDPAQAESFTLCIDCAPVAPGDVQVVPFSDIFAEVHPALCASAQVKHYRLIDFGKGGGLLAESVRQYIEQNPMGPDTIVLVDTITPEARDCLAVLVQAAGLVFQGR